MRVVGNPKIGLVQVLKAGVRHGNGILLALLLVVHEKPGAMRSDWASAAPAELLEYVHRARETMRLVDGVVRAGARIPVVVKSVLFISALSRPRRC